MSNQTWGNVIGGWMFVYGKVSTLVGAPILFCLLLVGAQKTLFTGTCALAGYQCKHGFGSAENIASSVSSAVSGGSKAHAEGTEEIEVINLQGFPIESRKKVLAAADKEAKRLAAEGN